MCINMFFVLATDTEEDCKVVEIFGSFISSISVSVCVLSNPEVVLSYIDSLYVLPGLCKSKNIGLTSIIMYFKLSSSLTEAYQKLWLSFSCNNRNK